MPKQLNVAEDIVPIAGFKSKAAHWLEQIAETGQHLVITQNGRAAGVLMSPGEYDRLQYRQRLVEEIATGIADIDAGRTVSGAQLKRELARSRQQRRRK